jgi:hypothetical protein
MTVFIRLLEVKQPDQALRHSIQKARSGDFGEEFFNALPSEFSGVPGVPFSYWASPKLRQLYSKLPMYDNEAQGRTLRCGLGTLNDFRYLRNYWEVARVEDAGNWVTYFDGGVFSPFFDDFSVVAWWKDNGQEIKAYVTQKVGSASRKVQGERFYYQRGFVFPRRTRAFCPKYMPSGGVFSTAGQAGFAPTEDISATIALLSSSVCNSLISLAHGAGGAPQFQVGLIKRLPWPGLGDKRDLLSELASRAWSVKREISSISETSHFFVLPLAIRNRIDDVRFADYQSELENIKRHIDSIAYELYGVSESDLQVSLTSPDTEDELLQIGDDQQSDSSIIGPLDESVGLLSWAVGVAFGRFDLRLATGEREAPLEPEPFDPLPSKSPGMLPDGAESFHLHQGILIDGPGHKHDLPRLIESVLERVDIPSPDNLRRWLRRDFFKEHLKQYSISRRKAPIYWPLSTLSGAYTLWLYYPQLNDQTLYTAVNEFIEPKLKLVEGALNALRSKSSRTAEEEREVVKQQDLQEELIELRDKALEIALNYKPNQDDGVQITAAPLWPLFHHKPWQKVLKDTWEKLEAGEYDWAHLAYSYWPDRVREKCKTDKSLAIAHGLEELYEEPAA